MAYRYTDVDTRTVYARSGGIGGQQGKTAKFWADSAGTDPIDVGLYSENSPSTPGASVGSNQLTVQSDQMWPAMWDRAGANPYMFIQIGTASSPGDLYKVFADADQRILALDAVLGDLGGAASLDVGTASGTVAAGNDSRLSDARAPTGQAIRLAVLGDSTARGTYSGDSQPGIGGATLYVGGNSWLTWASILSGGKILRIKNAGIIGNTLAQMDARVVTDVCTAAERPTACAVVSGYNDAFSGVTLASYMATMKSIVGKLRVHGIVPILCTPLPTANNAPIAALLAQYSVFVRRYAAEQSLFLIDFQRFATDPATGGLTSAIASGGDGVHPGIGGQKILGQYVSDLLAPNVAAAYPSLAVSPLDASNLIPNPLFTGSPTSGRAPSVFVFGALPSGVTPTVVTDSAVPGSMQRTTHSGSSTICSLAQRITQSGKWSPGDKLSVSGVLTVTGDLHAGIWMESNASPYTYNVPVAIDKDVTRGVFCAEVTIPPGSATNLDVLMQSGPGTGTVDFGQLTVNNLTTLGLA